MCGEAGWDDVEIITDSLDDVDPVDGEDTDDSVEQIIFDFSLELDVEDDDVDEDENFFPTVSSLLLVDEQHDEDDRSDKCWSGSLFRGTFISNSC